MRILIAEDDTVSREILEALLTQLGHDVVAAADGRDAWDLLTRDPVPLVISDWMMPDVDGLELCRRIRAEDRPKYTYVILLTTLGGKENYLEAMEAGADDFLTKPLDADQLAARLRVAERVLGLQRELVQLELTQGQLVQQERLRALGEMASGIAHDFSNALSAVLGFTDMLLRNPSALDDREGLRKRLELIHTAGLDATHLVRRLREFYRHRDESEAFAPCDVNKVVRTAVALTEPRWKAQAQAAGIAIHVETDLGLVRIVDGSASELRDVLMNLIFNAVDAMPQGGAIRIASALDGDRSVLITVTDTGVGMTEDVRRRCLEPFFTTKGDLGTGLGLAMTYGVIQRHGGAVDVESEPGRGTTFRIRLPVPTDRRPPVGSAAPEAASRALRVLVVDDEPVLRRLVAEFLTGDGHVVETAANGRHGLEQFQSATFDVVVTDRAMPVMNGIQLAAAIGRIASPRPAVIMLSGFGGEQDAFADLPPGVDVLLSKPVQLERLREALAQVG